MPCGQRQVQAASTVGGMELVGVLPCRGHLWASCMWDFAPVELRVVAGQVLCPNVKVYRVGLFDGLLPSLAGNRKAKLLSCCRMETRFRNVFNL